MNMFAIGTEMYVIVTLLMIQIVNCNSFYEKK